MPGLCLSFKLTVLSAQKDLGAHISNAYTTETIFSCFVWKNPPPGRLHPKKPVPDHVRPTHGSSQVSPGRGRVQDPTFLLLQVFGSHNPYPPPRPGGDGEGAVFSSKMKNIVLVLYAFEIWAPNSFWALRMVSLKLKCHSGTDLERIPYRVLTSKKNVAIYI